MAASTGAHRLGFFAGVTVLFLVVTSFHLRIAWVEAPLVRVNRHDGTSDQYLHLNYDHGTDFLHNTTREVDEHKFVATSQACRQYSDSEGVLLVMKTGATEIFERLPTQLLTTLKCVPDILLFSDMEQQLGSYYVHDALADIEDSVKAQNPDFALYNFQKSCPLSHQACFDGHQYRGNAWVLDKYKFMPMLEHTWRMRPGLDWYIFAEADTYVFWHNLIHWLKTKSNLSPSEPVYLGSRSFIGSTAFAHGGSGFVLSGVLLKHLIEENPGLVGQFSVKGASECCGDLLVAQALEKYEDVYIRQTWPMFNGEKPNTLPYGPGHWCEPIFTMHHVNSEEITSTWEFEKSKGDDVIMIKDLYEEFVAPKLQRDRWDWDNISDDVCYLNPDPGVQATVDPLERERQKPLHELTAVESEAWKSWENCAKVCEYEGVDETDDDVSEESHDYDTNDLRSTSEPSGVNGSRKLNPLDRQCFQYRYRQNVCCTSKSFKLGAPKPIAANEDSRHRMVSGWHRQGIDEWIDAMGGCPQPSYKIPEPPWG